MLYLQVADALYRFQVGVLSFSNPSGTDRNGQQCDPFDSTCDYVFDFCLQESHRSDCNLGVISTQHHNIQQNTYTFTLNDELIPGSGISNPLVYTDRAPLPTGNPWPVCADSITLRRIKGPYRLPPNGHIVYFLNKC